MTDNQVDQAAEADSSSENVWRAVTSCSGSAAAALLPEAKGVWQSFETNPVLHLKVPQVLMLLSLAVR